ncbi:UPF0481 protein At3g47200-like [Durio zibethinus]|uniref:UPF0481 protein At3g47200-like n=1 Tax=Durio zibethinus TaxID=66656 RepID=A0A6P6B8Z5_DURZI|nr:UPF0481 protein At3g47200-like [Durio zibethinus]
MAQGGRYDAAVIDIELVASSMENKINSHQLSLSADHCIFRTPSILARHKKEAYSPNCFSFGPFHHDQPNLKVTEKIKLKYLRGLLSRSGNQQAMLRECLDSIKEEERKARDCYAGIIDQNMVEAKNFVEMLVVDGCFIIELFRKDANVVPREDDDPIFSMSCMLQFLHHDLILLENQIPWLVLELLFNKTKASFETKSLIELALNFLANTFSSNRPSLNLDLFVGQEVKHILDLLRLSLVLPSEVVNNDRQKLEWQPIPSATRLKEAGVKFVRVTVDSILDMKFRNGVLEIPSLLIQETTETIFRNLISYEQCLPNCKPIFTSYAKIMDNLIDTTNDMEILCKKDIFDNWLSPEDATQFFNKLYNDTYVKEFYYSELCVNLNHHCQQWWPKWRSAYVHNYFSKPWAIAAQIYAIIMFILTLWQSFK